jgi:short-subunit dehydrogenase
VRERRELRGKVAVVTGAASGIARALCVQLAREGAFLGLVDRDAEGLASLDESLRAAGARCARVSVDVTDRRALGAAVRSLAVALGPAEILVACAGITGVTLVDDLAVEETEKLVRVNLLGVAHAIDAVLPGMVARRQGQIVALSSPAGCRGAPYSAAYSASKAGLINYLESLRPALRRHGIQVTTVLPGFVRTPLMEASRLRPPVPMMAPEEAARHVLRAIRRRSRVATFPWHTGLLVRVLRRLPPAAYDRVACWSASKIPDLEY